MPKAQPERRCIATGEVYPVKKLLRFALDAEGRVIPDIKGNLPGRGIWCLPNPKLLLQAVKTGAFARSAKGKVKVDESLIPLTTALLHKQMLNYLERAKVARLLVSGFSKVESMLFAGDASVLIHAKEASDDGCRKLDKKAEGSVLIIREISRDALSEALNHPNPIHIALQSGGLSLAFIAAYERWAGFCEKDSL